MTIKLNLPNNLTRKIFNLAPQKEEQVDFVVQAIKYYLNDIWFEGEQAKRQRALQTIKCLAEKSGNWDGTAEIVKWRETK